MALCRGLVSHILNLLNIVIMTTQLTPQQACNTRIFVIENNQVVETDLFSHVSESAEQTNSPRGVMHKLFVENLQDEETGEDRYALREWHGSKSYLVSEIFDTEEDAKNEWFRRVYEYDFMPDDQRDTAYWNTRSEAENELRERI